MQRFLSWTGKIAAALFISLAIWEILLRLTILSPIPYADNARLGWVPAPGSVGMSALEGRGVLRFNELGLRDGPIQAPVAGETRIVCLGDSYTLGAQMDASQTYPRQLENLLGERGVSQPRVINAGRAGTTIAYSVGLADAYKDLLAPDWTVVQIRDGWFENFNRDQEVHFVAAGEGFETVFQSHWKSMSPRMKQLIRWHIRDIALFQYGNRHLAELRKGSPGEGEGAGAPQPAATPPRNTGAPSVYIASSERDLRSIGGAVAQLKANYPRLILLHLPYALPDNSGLMPPQREEQELIAQCRQQGVALITMRGAYLRDYQNSRCAPIGFANTLPWQGHPNGRAHALIAQELAAYLVPRLDKK